MEMYKMVLEYMLNVMLFRFVSATFGLLIPKIAPETLVGAEHLESVYRLRCLCFSLASPSTLFF